MLEQEHREPQIVHLKAENAPDTKKPPEGGSREPFRALPAMAVAT
jgi:hypothetical protein